MAFLSRLRTIPFSLPRGSQRRFCNIPTDVLRDNCACKECRNPTTKQRTYRYVESGAIAKVKRWTGKQDGFYVEWADGHRSRYSTASPVLVDSIRKARQQPRAWDWSSLPSTSINSPTRLTSIAHNLATYGLCIVSGVQNTLSATEDVVRMIGPIKNTHFGACHIVQADLHSNDTAYTTASLDQHTDTTYYTLPIRILAMHALSQGTGGESILVDGFAAAAKLKEQDEEAYGTLSRIGVHHHASGNEGSIQTDESFPVLEHNKLRLFRLRYNNADRAHVSGNAEQITAWYKASRKLAAIMQDPANQVRFQLAPGSVLLIDNWRVTHGRTAYTGHRQLATAYVEHDFFLSFLKQHLYSKDEVALTYRGF